VNWIGGGRRGGVVVEEMREAEEVFKRMEGG
jgi:hypothetical protein